MFKEASLRDNNNIYFDEFVFAMVEARRLHTKSSFSILVDKVEASVNRESGKLVFFTFLFVTFLVLAGNSTALFQYLKCHNFHEAENGTESYLYVDYSIDCDSNRYKYYLPYVYCMIAIYPLGIPLMYASMLYVHRKILRNPLKLEREERTGFPTIGHLTFLVQAYKPQFFWFEVLECGRRILLASVIGMFSEYSAKVPAWGLVVCLGFCWVFAYLKPFKNSDDSSLGVTLAYSLALLFMAALTISVDGIKRSVLVSDSFSFVLIIILVSGLIHLAIQNLTFFAVMGGRGMNNLRSSSSVMSPKNIGEEKKQF
jgi:hypothetical protein